MKTCSLKMLIGISVLISLFTQACAQNSPVAFPLNAYGTKVQLSVRESGDMRPFDKSASGNPLEQASIAIQSKLLDGLISDFKSGKVNSAPGDSLFAVKAVVIKQPSFMRITVQSSAPVLIGQLFDNSSQDASETQFLFPPVWNRGAGTWVLDIPIIQIKELAGFRLSCLPAQSSCTVLSAAIEAGYPLNLQFDERIMPAGFRELGSQNSLQYEVPMDTYADASEPGYLDIAYECPQDKSKKPTAIDFEVWGMSSGKPVHKHLILRPRVGKPHFYLYDLSLGFTPQKLIFSKSLPGFQVASVSKRSYALPDNRGASAWDSPQFQAPKPLPADIWARLNFPQAAWRQNSMEVFSWNLLPEIVIIDFASLEIQDRFVKRMVFYVEKKGYRGSLQANQEIEPKHGWNANDFSAASLANFYSAVQRQNFPLNEEELYLRECLIQWGVIIKNASEYSPGKGGLLSLAHGPRMTSLNRSLLLQHEALHGVYFALPAFQQKAEASFAAMPAGARNFMLDYFSFYQYDPKDHDLMVNETMAYLLQQSLGSLNSYITGNMVKAYSLVYPDREKNFLKNAQSNASALYRTAQNLSDELFKLTGLVNGQLACISEE